jgi:hypothetical protein
MGLIRGHGCRDLLVYCTSPWCDHSAKHGCRELLVSLHPLDVRLRVSPDGVGTVAAGSSKRMHDDDQEKPPSRTCDQCGAPMELMCTLPASAHFPMERCYRCFECKFVIADTVDHCRSAL